MKLGLEEGGVVSRSGEGRSAEMLMLPEAFHGVYGRALLG